VSDYRGEKFPAYHVSVQKVPIARLAKPPKPEFTHRKWVFWRQA